MSTEAEWSFQGSYILSTFSQLKCPSKNLKDKLKKKKKKVSIRKKRTSGEQKAKLKLPGSLVKQGEEYCIKIQVGLVVKNPLANAEDTEQKGSWGNQNWKRHMYPMFITALFTIARTRKQPRCPSADEWIRKLWYVYTMEYYSAIKKNAFESVLMRWMKLGPILQSEVSQKEKHQYSKLMHICGI